MKLRRELGIDHFDDVSNVFLEGSCLNPASDEACRAFVESAGEGVSVIVVSVTRSPRAHVATLERQTECTPGRITVLNVSPDRQGVDDVSSATETEVEVVSTVGTPNDLTNLGVAVTDRLDAQSDDVPVTVCFHSVTPLLQFNPLEDVFHFLRILSQRIEAADATAHYHYDPTAHDKETTSRLHTLFDHAIDVSDETPESAPFDE